MRHLALAAALPLFLLGCMGVSERSEPEIDLEAERALLLERDRAQAEAYSASKTPPAFTDDVRVLAPGIPMAEGLEASRAVFAELEELPGYSLEYTPEIAEIGGAADLGYTIGTYYMTLPDSAGNITEVVGKYLSIWERQRDGSWKLAVDMFNTNGPPVPAEP